MQTIEASLASIAIIQRLQNYDDTDKQHSCCGLLQAIHLCIKGEEQTLLSPAVPTYLDHLLANHQLLGGLTLELDSQHINVISITNLPAETSRVTFNILESLPIPFRWSTRYIALNRHAAETIIHKQRKLWSQKSTALLDQLTRKHNPASIGTPWIWSVR